MKKFVIVFLFSSCVYATGNNDLLTLKGNYCHDIEKNIYDKKVDNSLLDEINNCLQGNTYYMNKHRWHNTCWTDSPCEQLPLSLDKDGDKYKLQYFESMDQINDAITEIDDQVQANAEASEKAHQEQAAKEADKVRQGKIRSDKLKSCNSAYIHSAEYINYISTRNTFLKTRYNTCIDNGYSSMDCWSFKIKDQVGYDIEHKAPKNNCR